MNLQNNLARYAARRQIGFMKRYHIGRVFKKTPKGSFEHQRDVLESLEASFDILCLPSTTNSQSNNGDEFIYEAEALKVCD